MTAMVAQAPVDALTIDPPMAAPAPAPAAEAAPDADAAPDAAPDGPPDAEEEAQAIQRRMMIARNRMLRRLHEVSRRVDHARERLDVAHMIREQPLAACGIAAGAGLLVGMIGGGGRGGAVGRGGAALVGKLGGTLTALALTLAKDRLGAWIADAFERAPAPTER